MRLGGRKKAGRVRQGGVSYSEAGLLVSSDVERSQHLQDSQGEVSTYTAGGANSANTRQSARESGPIPVLAFSGRGAATLSPSANQP